MSAVDVTDWTSAEPASSVSGYIQRQANALRRDLGLAEVDYAREELAAKIRRSAPLREAMLGFQAICQKFPLGSFEITGL